MMEALTEGIDVSIANRTIEDLYGKSVFLIDEAEIANSIKKYQKNIKEIRIDRLYPNWLKILLTAYPIYFDVTTPALTTKSWWMTENGILIPRDEVGKPGKYKFVFYGDTLLEDTLLDYKELLPESRARIIEKTLSFLEENWPDMKIEKTYYFERENELHIVLEWWAHILFTLQDFREKVGEIPLYKNLKSELLTLKTFLTDKKSDVIGGKYTYIDVRIPGKVFSCSEKNLCLSNLKMIYGEDYK